MKFYTDENVSPRAARMLDIFDQFNEIAALTDRFDRGTPDTTWLVELGRDDPKPFVLSGDGRVLKRPAERRALKESGLTYFVLAGGWNKAAWNDQAWRLIRVWPTITGIAAETRRQTIFNVAFAHVKVTRSQNL